MPDISTARHIAFGTDDQSTRQVFPENKGTPQFVPLFHLNTPRGPYKRTHATGAEFASTFGIEGLTPTSDFANFATVTANKIAANSSFVTQRLMTKVDIGQGMYRDAQKAGLVVYVVIKKIPLLTLPGKRFSRDQATGAIVRDAQGVPVYYFNDLTADSFEVGIFTQYLSDVSTATTIVGADTVTTAYPIIGLQAEAHGDWYNNIGVTLTPNVGDDLNSDMWDKNKTLTYTLKVWDKSTGVKKVVTTVIGGTNLEFALKPNTANPTTGKGISLNFNFPNVYGNDVDPLKPLKPYIFDKGFKMYDMSALHLLMQEMWRNEIVATFGPQSWTDFGNVDEANVQEVTDAGVSLAWGMNLFTRLNSKGIGYEVVREMLPATVAQMTTLTQIAISSDTVAYLTGGEDGALDTTQFEAAVVADMARYADANDIVQSIPLNKETCIVDPGYTLATKLKLTSLISRRRNTMLGLSTHTFNEANTFNDVATDTSVASTLLSTLALYLESSEFNTPAMRAYIIMGSGFTIDGNYPYRVPLVLDYAVKLAKYTGALNGVRNGSFAFSRQSGNIISELFDIEPKYIPDSALDTIHKSGLIRPDNNDLLEFFYPSHQTIYTNDTSVLNNVLTVQAITTLTTINDKIWRRYSGADDLSDIELKIAVEEDYNNEVAGIFNSEYTIKPEVFYTERDVELGWIYRLRVNIYANNSKTQQYSHVIALRASDL